MVKSGCYRIASELRLRVSVAMQRALDQDSVGNVFDLRVPPGRRDINGHRFLDYLQSFCPLAAYHGSV
jgi:hypothetical protein